MSQETRGYQFHRCVHIPGFCYSILLALDTAGSGSVSGKNIDAQFLRKESPGIITVLLFIDQEKRWKSRHIQFF